MIYLYFSNSAVIAQVFNSTTIHVIPTGKQINEANTEIEMQPVIVEARISECST